MVIYSLIIIAHVMRKTMPRVGCCTPIEISLRFRETVNHAMRPRRWFYVCNTFSMGVVFMTQRPWPTGLILHNVFFDSAESPNRSQPRIVLFFSGRKDTIPLDTRRCCDVELTSLTLIQRRNNVVCPVGYTILNSKAMKFIAQRAQWEVIQRSLMIEV